MASRSSVWRKQMKASADRWEFHDANRNGKGKPFWECRCCHYKVSHANTPKDPDTALRAHLREVKRHEKECSA